jgi:putative membrane protein
MRSPIALRDFVRYKCLNALFTGLSVGSIFIIYTPLQPWVYSLGGIVLALAMLLIARYYVAILNRTWFWRISMGVEIVMALLVLYFLIFSYSYVTALFVYAGYQLTFAFGAYLVRAETILIRKAKALTWLDVYKQIGYLAGMVVSFLFYKGLELGYGIEQSSEQVYLLHYLLLLVEVSVIYYLYRAFHPKVDSKQKLS